MGVLGWPPNEFWEATPLDLHLAVEGWQEANGSGDGADPVVPLTRDELFELMERHPDVKSEKPRG